MSGVFDNEAPESAEPRDTLEWLRASAAEAGDAAMEERAATAIAELDSLERRLADAQDALAGFATGFVIDIRSRMPQYLARRQDEQS